MPERNKRKEKGQDDTGAAENRRERQGKDKAKTKQRQSKDKDYTSVPQREYRQCKNSAAGPWRIDRRFGRGAAGSWRVSGYMGLIRWMVRVADIYRNLLMAGYMNKDRPQPGRRFRIEKRPETSCSVSPAAAL